MNFEISTTHNNFVTGSFGAIPAVNFESDEVSFSQTFPEDYETYGQTVLAEISRIRNVSREEAREFVDFSTFDEIVECLRNGLSAMGEMEPGILAMTFCHISTN